LSGLPAASILALILCSIGLRIIQLSLDLKLQVDAACLTKTLAFMPQLMAMFSLYSFGLN